MQIQGVKVVDGKKPITLVIKPEDISKGKRKNVNSCAAAQACSRQLHAVDTVIQKGRIYIKRRAKSNWERYNMPRSLQLEMVAFDRGGSFEPGDYIIKPMAKTQRLGAQRGSNKTTRNAKPKHRRKMKIHQTANIRHSVVSRATTR